MMSEGFFDFAELYCWVKIWFQDEWKIYIQSEETVRFIPEWMAGNFLEHFPFMEEYRYMILDVCRLLNEEFVNNKRRQNYGNLGRTS
jgi:hypothetical protein